MKDRIVMGSSGSRFKLFDSESEEDESEDIKSNSFDADEL